MQSGFIYDWGLPVFGLLACGAMILAALLMKVRFDHMHPPRVATSEPTKADVSMTMTAEGAAKRGANMASGASEMMIMARGTLQASPAEVEATGSVGNVSVIRYRRLGSNRPLRPILVPSREGNRSLTH